ncbi:MAG: YjfB family protein [Lachnospiraceae bacterium]|nr:YjfB family protein [Lachnospiraceae bacterium]
MDIAGLSTYMSQAKVMNSLGTAVLKMNLDMMSDVGEMLTDTMNAMPGASLESLVNPAVGGNIDIAV